MLLQSIIEVSLLFQSVVSLYHCFEIKKYIEKQFFGISQDTKMETQCQESIRKEEAYDVRCKQCEYENIQTDQKLI